jgi:hypothetical protein
LSSTLTRSHDTPVEHLFSTDAVLARRKPRTRPPGLVFPRLHAPAAVGRLQDHLGDSPARASTAANRSTSLTMRTVSSS